MKVRSLNNFRSIRLFVTGLRKKWLARHGIDIHPSASVSLSSRMVGGTPGAIVIGEETLVAFKTLLLTRTEGGEVRPIRVGRRCFIGGGSIILPGVAIGDESIVGAGAVVSEDVPPRSIVAGNPARIIRSDIKVGKFGRLEGADDNSRKMYTS